MSAKHLNIPRDENAERVTLGAIIVANEGIDLVADILAPEDFYSSAHREIFLRVLELHAAGPVDLVTLKRALDAEGRLDMVGGMPYLSGLVDGIPSVLSVAHYAAIVRERSLARALLARAVEIQRDILESGDNAEDLIDRAGKAILSVAERKLEVGPLPQRETLAATLAHLEAARKAGTIPGVKSGFENLDRMLGALARKSLVILAGRPSSGKTAMALDIVRNVARAGTNTVLMFSLEMGASEVQIRMLCGEAAIDSHPLRTGAAANDWAWQKFEGAFTSWSAAKLWIDESGSVTLPGIRARATALHRANPLSLIVVDYLQLMGGHDKRDNREQELASISRGLKILAKDLDVPVLALSQLNRASEEGNRPPRLSDLRGSGAIEQDADVVLLIHRQEQREATDENRGIAEVTVAKNRNGPVGELHFWFVPDAGPQFQAADLDEGMRAALREQRQTRGGRRQWKD